MSKLAGTPENKGGVLGGVKLKTRSYSNFSRNNNESDSGAPSECNLNLSKTTKPVDSEDQLKYPRSAAYSAKHCRLNKQQMWGAVACVHGVICKKQRNVR